MGYINPKRYGFKGDVDHHHRLLAFRGVLEIQRFGPSSGGLGSMVTMRELNRSMQEEISKSHALSPNP